MKSTYSYVLQKQVTIDEFAHEYARLNQAFFDASDEAELLASAKMDHDCTQLLDEVTDWISREGIAAERMLLVIVQAEASTKERADVLRELILARHRQRLATRMLMLTKNGFVAATRDPKSIGETVPHGHMYGVH
mmetsp:Transcript_6392/g.15328  ORF Transcript_6392/g.15328 Transcript_6392/m.15328 type:complete len:135 (+) Transcript_6392:128-532(+)